MIIKGTLVAIGGNEDKGTKRKLLHVEDTIHDFVTSGILYRVKSEMANGEAPIEVITTASEIPDIVGKNYIRAFKKLGHKKVRTMHLTTREEAEKQSILDRIANAGCVMFSGGDQFKLIEAFKDTEFSRLIHDRYVHDDIVIAGTSAGAMAMSDLMIYPGPGPMQWTSPEVPLYEGLALVHQAIIDTHFLVRGRFRRLAFSVAKNPHHLGIGLEEDTGVIIRKGNKLETIGSGLVTIVDGEALQDPNKTVAASKHDICIENLVVHVLCHGNNFTLRKRKIS